MAFEIPKDIRKTPLLTGEKMIAYIIGDKFDNFLQDLFRCTTHRDPRVNVLSDYEVCNTLHRRYYGIDIPEKHCKKFKTMNLEDMRLYFLKGHDSIIIEYSKMATDNIEMLDFVSSDNRGPYYFTKPDAMEGE